MTKDTKDPTTTIDKKQESKALIKASNAPALVDGLKRAERTLVTFLGTAEMAQRAWKVAYVLVRRTPDLQRCSVESIVSGMLESAQAGLELGTEAYLVPFKNKDTGQLEASFIADWKGLVRLAVREGVLTGGHGDLVYPGDEYLYERTSEGVTFRHVRQRFGARAKQDNLEAHVKAGCQGVYFIGYRPDGAPPVVEELSVSDVEYVRKTYSKQPNSPLWAKRWSAGAIKTATKQAMKLVPRTARLEHVIELDNRHETGIQTTVLNGDEEAVAPYQEPKPLGAGQDEEQKVRDEDAGLAKE